MLVLILSVFSMNFLLAFAFSAKRIAKVDIIFESAKFIFKIFEFFSCAIRFSMIFLHISAFSAKRIAKVDIIFEYAKIF